MSFSGSQALGSHPHAGHRSQSGLRVCGWYCLGTGGRDRPRLGRPEGSSAPLGRGPREAVRRGGPRSGRSTGGARRSGRRLPAHRGARRRHGRTRAGPGRGRPRREVDRVGRGPGARGPRPGASRLEARGPRAAAATDATRAGCRPGPPPPRGPCPPCRAPPRPAPATSVRGARRAGRRGPVARTRKAGLAIFETHAARGAPPGGEPRGVARGWSERGRRVRDPWGGAVVPVPTQWNVCLPKRTRG